MLQVGELAIDIVERRTLDNSLREGEIAKNYASVGHIFDDIYEDLKIKCLGVSPSASIAPQSPN